jgi:deoxyribodipyrimidine photo-lyase
MNSDRGVIFWFRNDLRLHDQPALRRAVDLADAAGSWLLPVYVHGPRVQAMSDWGITRSSPLRQAWIAMALRGLADSLAGLGSQLIELQGDPSTLLAGLAQQLGAAQVICEEIPAPEEIAEVQALEAHRLRLETIWQSTLWARESLPFDPAAMSDQFTRFRQQLEGSGIQPKKPLPVIDRMPPLPSISLPALSLRAGQSDLAMQMPEASLRRSAFPIGAGQFDGSENCALRHLREYCAKRLPHRYKSTRNGLLGIDYSTKFSPWLATGALSAREAWAEVLRFEERHGANDSTYWIRFELLWRDYYRWLHLKYGRRLYRAGGLTDQGSPAHDPEAFERWCQGRTGHPFIDAGMRELLATGYLSNRMRQNVASFLIHDLRCDWRAGAAWFEHHLLDFDVFSNQGNWLYASGRGTDPRGPRRFNPDKQAQDYDPDGSYRKRWIAA